MNKPELTAFITLYNDRDKITPLIKSILRQKQESYTLKEILIIDDNSTDGSIEDVDKIRSSFIKVIKNKENKGQRKRLNDGFKRIGTDLILKIDSDFYFERKNIIDNMVTSLYKNNTYLEYGICEFPNARTLAEKIVTFEKNLISSLKKDSSNVYQKICGFYILKKELYKKIKIPKNIIEEDVFAFFTAKRECLKVSTNVSEKILTEYPASSLLNLIRVYTRYKTCSINKFFPKLLIERNTKSLLKNKSNIIILIVELSKSPILSTIYIILRLIVILNKKINPSNNKWRS